MKNKLIFVDDFFDNHRNENITDADVSAYQNYAKNYILASNSKINSFFTFRKLEAFILWEYPDELGGAWYDKAALVMIDDHSNAYDLDSNETAMARLKTFEKYNVFNLPRKYQLIWSGCKNTDNKNTYTHKKIKTNDNNICSTTSMTHEEYLHIRSLMNDDERIRHDINIHDEIEKYKDSEYIGVTKENPICIYLCGNDDLSYSISVHNMKKANEIIDMILEKPTIDNLKKLGFRFTN